MTYSMSQLSEAGLEIVMTHSSRRVLKSGNGYEIRLTTGEDGNGRQSGKLSVVLLVKNESNDGWRVRDSISIPHREEFVEKKTDALGRGRALCDLAKIADIDSAAETLLRRL
jgi:hypothetical protein